MLIFYITALSNTDVLYGFERSTLEVSETVSNIEVCIITFNPGLNEPFDGTIEFQVESLPGAAGL